MSNLAEVYPKEQARCRELLEIYASLGPVGAFGHAVVSGVLAHADKAAVEGDVTQMIVAYKRMQECQ